MNSTVGASRACQQCPDIPGGGRNMWPLDGREKKRKKERYAAVPVCGD